MTFLSIENLSKAYPASRMGMDDYCSTTQALDGVTLQIKSQEILALVGESGSGKTTLARCILKFVPADGGRIVYQNQDLLQLPEREFRKVRPRFQMIFQHPSLALNPRHRVGETIAEPLRIIKGFGDGTLKDRIFELLNLVGLDADVINRYPRQLSGGQQQKVVIARALALEPEFIIADEPTSSIDAIYKKQIIQLLKKLNQQFGLTLLLISHDLDLVAEISDRVAVLYRGVLVELGTTEQIIKSPLHPYTRRLLEFSQNSQNLSSHLFTNRLNTNGTHNHGCVFKAQCSFAREECQSISPDQFSVSEDHAVSCHFAFQFMFDESTILTGVN